MPDNLQQEMPLIRQAFNELGVACWHSPGNEADDLAATLVVKVAGAGHQVTIVSTDKGYCQLLAPNIQIRDYFQKRWLDMPFVKQEFGVLPRQLPDYWGWRGSAAVKFQVLQALVPKPLRCYCNKPIRWKCSIRIWNQYRRNGVKNYNNTNRWRLPANKSPR